MDGALHTLYERIGGIETCRRLSELFHNRIAGDFILKEVFPKNLANTTERLALFLAEKLGGPADYTDRRGKQSLLCRHAHVPIGPAEVEAWLRQMFAAIDEIGLIEPVRQLLHDYFTQTASSLSDPFLPLYRLPLDELQAILEQDSALAATGDRGRTLLSDAAGRWDLPRVQVLLQYGGNVNAQDRWGHDALYRAAGAMAPQPEIEGRSVVELLIQHGADVNGRSGSGMVTPLHMAARRGAVTIARALLDAGAELEAQDAKGETPLRRAVNCGQEDLVRLLLSHDADPLTQDKQGRTALAAARQERIREALWEAAGN